MRALLLIPVMLLAACGSGTSAPADPNTIIGGAFQATSLISNGAAQPIVAGSTINVTFAASDVNVNATCNTMSGPATYTSTQIVVEQMASTRMACDPPLMTQDEWLAAFFANDPAWVLDGSTLTLTAGQDSMTLKAQ